MTLPACGQPAARWRFENAEFDEALGTLLVDGAPVAVEPRPLRLLAELLRHPGQVLSKEQLLASVWQGRPTVDHVLPSAVNRLRRALGPQAGMCIVTLPRQGYRFVGTLQRSTGGAGSYDSSEGSAGAGNNAPTVASAPEQPVAAGPDEAPAAAGAGGTSELPATALPEAPGPARAGQAHGRQADLSAVRMAATVLGLLLVLLLLLALVLAARAAH